MTQATLGRAMRALFLVVLLAGCAAVEPESQAPPATRPTVHCGPRGAVIEVLQRRYGERQIATGVGLRGGLIEVYASASRAFTILVTSPGGLSCVVATGEGWRDIEKQPEDQGASQ